MSRRSPLVALGEAFDAERMLDITYANVLLGSSFWGGVH